jgi:HEPN domain-containing protein
MHAKADEISLLMRKAQHDLRAMRSLLSEELPDIVCFHAQQAAEKALKALLLRHGILYPHKHDLADLIALLPEMPTALGGLGQRISALTPYATTERYEEIILPSDEEAQRAYSIALTVYKAVATAIREQLPEVAIEEVDANG